MRMVWKFSICLALILCCKTFLIDAVACGGELCDRYINCSASLYKDATKRIKFSSIFNEFRNNRTCQYNHSESESQSGFVEDCLELFSNHELHNKLLERGVPAQTRKLYWKELNTTELQSKAAMYCKGFGPQSEPLKIETAEEMNLVECLRDSHFLWLGITYRGGNQTYNRSFWKWNDDTVTSYQPWEQGNEEPTGSYLENCALVGNLKFRKRPCMSFNRSAACYVDSAPTDQVVDSIQKSILEAVESFTNFSANLSDLVSLESDLVMVAAEGGNNSIHKTIDKVVIYINKLNTTERRASTGLIQLTNATSFNSTFRAGNDSNVFVLAFEVSFHNTSRFQQCASSHIMGSATYLLHLSPMIFTGVSGYDVTTNSTLNGSISLSKSVAQDEESNKRVCEKLAKETSNTSSKGLTLEEVQLTCVFIVQSSGAYSTAGCRTRVDGSRIFCQCDHHTVFSVLLSVKMVGLTQEVKILSYVCESISVAFLMATIALLVKHKREISSDRTLIQLNIAIALTLLHVVNLVHDAAVNDDTMCLILTAAIQYFLLATGIWFMFDGIRMAMALAFPIRFHTEDPEKRNRAFLVMGWFVPALIVGSALAVGLLYSGNYMKPSTHYEKCHQFQQNIRKYDICWLAPGTLVYILSVTVPLGIVLVFNFFASLIAAYAALPFRGREKRRQGEEMENAKKFISSFVFVLLVLGASWVLGFLTGLGNEVTSLVMTYIHTTVNGLQGVVVFIFYCLQNGTIAKKLGCPRKLSKPTSSNFNLQNRDSTVRTNTSHF